MFSYRFDTFDSSDEFLVIELSGSFDCIFGMPWLARHRPDIDWLNRTVQPRESDVNAVLAVFDGPTMRGSMLLSWIPTTRLKIPRSERWPFACGVQLRKILLLSRTVVPE